jgi:hypothetical protein
VALMTEILMGKIKGGGYICGRFVLQGAAQQMNDIFVTF